jgi:hypothetical protein
MVVRVVGVVCGSERSGAGSQLEKETTRTSTGVCQARALNWLVTDSLGDGRRDWHPICKHTILTIPLSDPRRRFEGPINRGTRVRRDTTAIAADLEWRSIQSERFILTYVLYSINFRFLLKISRFY